MISASVLKQVSPNANTTIVAGLAQYLPQALARFQINTPLRMAHFIGQCAEESAGFRTLTEYASGQEYEGRRDLGNVQSGDGVRFRGRGLIMITGRYNYGAYGRKLALDLVANPALASEPEYAVLIACQYWVDHGLNALADADDIVSITRKINGGENGLADRKLYTARAKTALQHAATVAAAPVLASPVAAIPNALAPVAVPAPVVAASNTPGFWSRLHTLLSRKPNS